jgi:hypothetical protein
VKDLGVPTLTGGPVATRMVVVRMQASRRSYRIAHLIQVAKGVEEVLGTISAFVQTGLSLAYLADQAHVAYKARQVIAREQEQEVEDAEIVSEMETLIQKIDIEAARKQARTATITFKIPDEPEQQDNR